MMKSLYMKPVVMGMLLSTLAFGGTYDYNYSPLNPQSKLDKEKDPFMYGDFDKVIRFKALVFDGDTLSGDSDKEFEKIVKAVERYKEDNKTLGVSIIAHTAPTTDDPNENSVRSKTYANTIIEWFSRDLDTNASKKVSETYAQDVQKVLVDRGVDKSLTHLEYRGGNDLAFSDETSEGRNLSNRVLVTLYVSTPEVIELDSDGDGVLDKTDECPKTPRGVEVDTVGCPFDTDGDGVYDYLDQCPGTPEGVEVNNLGCPLDSDGDGVYDYLDQCPGTPANFRVDDVGCPLSKKLMVTFASWSHVIRKESYQEVKEFAKFLKENEQYKAEIVGHTDSIGKKAANMKLSLARSNAIKEALINEGINPTRLSTNGRGELEPVANNRTKEGRQINRRIEVKLHY